MTTAINNRQAKLEAFISQLAGVQVEITIVSETFFSFGFEGDNPAAAQKIVNYFTGSANVENDGYDEECDFTVIYVRTK